MRNSTIIDMVKTMIESVSKITVFCPKEIINNDNKFYNKIIYFRHGGIPKNI